MMYIGFFFWWRGELTSLPSARQTSRRLLSEKPIGTPRAPKKAASAALTCGQTVTIQPSCPRCRLTPKCSNCGRLRRRQPKLAPQSRQGREQPL